MPVDDINKLKEDGNAVDGIKEIQLGSVDPAQVVLNEVSGNYHFDF